MYDVKMKKLFVSPNITECDIVRSFLEGVGIPTMLKNEYTTRTAGVGPFGGLPFAWPEVWVNDADYELAVSTLKESDMSFL